MSYRIDICSTQRPSTIQRLARVLALFAYALFLAGVSSAHEEGDHADLPDFSYDTADSKISSQVWDNPLLYDADLLAQDDQHWYAWLELLPGEGDVLWLGCKQGAEWINQQKLKLPPAEYAAPTLTRDGQGRTWLTYEARVGDQWDLFSVVVEDCQAVGSPQKVSDAPGSDILHKTCATSDGLWIVWQSDNGGHFDIFARQLKQDEWQPIQQVSENPHGDWHPAVAVTTNNRVCVAWDAYDGNSYNVVMRCLEKGQWNASQRLASSSRFEGRVDLAADKRGRVFAVWEAGAENWGKPFRGIQTELVSDASGPLHRHRTLQFAVIDADGTRQKLTHELPMPALEAARQRPHRPDGLSESGAFYERARIAFDQAGRLWLTYRHYYTPWLGIAHRSHVEQGWGLYARCYGEEGWSQLHQFDIGQGDGMQRLELAPAEDGVRAVWTTGRTDRLPSQRPRGIASALVRNTQTIDGGLPLQVDETQQPQQNQAKFASPSRPRTQVAGEEYQLVFGDLHRHTDLSLCRVPLDGTMDDAYRYATDVAQLDFLGITDHTRDIAQGDPLSQLWWRSRKEVYRRQLVQDDAMRFFPFYAYERSHGNTADHNVISLRGDMLRPFTYPVPKFWEELDQQTITIPHNPIRRDTWNYQSDALRPVVEIFQGCRDESIAEHVHEGLDKGYHLGFIASSDHMSTSASYAGVWVETVQREPVFRALQTRRTFAATAKIELQLTANGKHWMGEILPTSDQPVELALRVKGTAPIRTVELIVDGVVEKTFTPRDDSVQLTESINPLGKRYAYFHLVQRDGNEAWSSPVWFDGTRE